MAGKFRSDDDEYDEARLSGTRRTVSDVHQRLGKRERPEDSEKPDLRRKLNSIISGGGRSEDLRGRIGNTERHSSGSSDRRTGAFKYRQESSDREGSGRLVRDSLRRIEREDDSRKAHDRDDGSREVEFDPVIVPRGGMYFEHDDRGADGRDFERPRGRGSGRRTYFDERASRSNVDSWPKRQRVSSPKWSHDKFAEVEQDDDHDAEMDDDAPEERVAQELEREAESTFDPETERRYLRGRVRGRGGPRGGGPWRGRGRSRLVDDRGDGDLRSRLGRRSSR